MVYDTIDKHLSTNTPIIRLIIHWHIVKCLGGKGKKSSPGNFVGIVLSTIICFLYNWNFSLLRCLFSIYYL